MANGQGQAANGLLLARVLPDGPLAMTMGRWPLPLLALTVHADDPAISQGFLLAVPVSSHLLAAHGAGYPL